MTTPGHSERLTPDELLALAERGLAALPPSRHDAARRALNADPDLARRLDADRAARTTLRRLAQTDADAARPHAADAAARALAAARSATPAAGSADHAANDELDLTALAELSDSLRSAHAADAAGPALPRSVVKPAKPDGPLSFSAWRRRAAAALATAASLPPAAPRTLAAAAALAIAAAGLWFLGPALTSLNSTSPEIAAEPDRSAAAPRERRHPPATDQPQPSLATATNPAQPATASLDPIDQPRYRLAAAPSTQDLAGDPALGLSPGEQHLSLRQAISLARIGRLAVAIQSPSPNADQFAARAANFADLAQLARPAAPDRAAADAAHATDPRTDPSTEPNTDAPNAPWLRIGTTSGDAARRALDALARSAPAPAAPPAERSTAALTATLRLHAPSDAAAHSAALPTTATAIPAELLQDAAALEAALAALAEAAQPETDAGSTTDADADDTPQTSFKLLILPPSAAAAPEAWRHPADVFWWRGSTPDFAALRYVDLPVVVTAPHADD